MASAFNRLDLAAQRVHDRVFGELFTHKPKTRAANVNAPWVDDTSRTQRTITAIYTERDVPEDLPESIDVREDRRPGVSTHRHTIEVGATAGINVNPGDIFVRAADGSSWRVNAVDLDDANRQKCTVNRI